MHLNPGIFIENSNEANTYQSTVLGAAQTGILDSVGFILEANQPNCLNPGGQRGKPDLPNLISRFKCMDLNAS